MKEIRDDISGANDGGEDRVRRWISTWALVVIALSCATGSGFDAVNQFLRIASGAH